MLIQEHVTFILRYFKSENLTPKMLRMKASNTTAPEAFLKTCVRETTAKPTSVSCLQGTKSPLCVPRKAACCTCWFSMGLHMPTRVNTAASLLSVNRALDPRDMMYK